MAIDAQARAKDHYWEAAVAHKLTLCEKVLNAGGYLPMIGKVLDITAHFPPWMMVFPQIRWGFGIVEIVGAVVVAGICAQSSDAATRKMAPHIFRHYSAQGLANLFRSSMEMARGPAGGICCLLFDIAGYRYAYPTEVRTEKLEPTSSV